MTVWYQRPQHAAMAVLRSALSRLYRLQGRVYYFSMYKLFVTATSWLALAWCVRKGETRSQST